MIFLNNIKKMKIGGKAQMIIKYGAVMEIDRCYLTIECSRD